MLMFSPWDILKRVTHAGRGYLLCLFRADVLKEAQEMASLLQTICEQEQNI